MNRRRFLREGIARAPSLSEPAAELCRSTANTHLIKGKMMKPAALLSVAVSSTLFAGVAICAQGETDKQRLEGAWQVTSLELEGLRGPAEAIKGLTYNFKGDTLKIAPAEPGSNSEFTVALDPAKKPKRIDLKVTKGPDKGKTSPGIYDIEGNSLKICFGDKTRPVEFVSKAKSGVALVVLKRRTAK